MKQAARWIAIIALFAIPFLPLYVASDLYFPFITGKNFAFRILVEIALAAHVVLAVLDRRFRPKFSWILAVFAGFVVWMAIANLLGVHPLKAFWSNFERMDGWITLIHIFILFIVAGTVLSVENLWRRWWMFFVAVAALVCGLGLLQLSGVTETHQGGSRLDAALGNAIYLAVYLMFSIFIAAWLAVTSRGWLRYLLVGFIAFAVLILFFTGSRGPLVGLVGGVGFGAVLWLILSVLGSKGTNTRTSIKLGASVLAVLVLAVGILFVVRDSSFVQENFMLSRAASVFSLNEELKVRGTIWGLALEGIKEDPLTGWGQEGFNQIFNKYYEPSLYAQESWFDRAHNMYIDWLVAGGIPALTFFVALLLMAMLAILRAPGMSRAERVLLVSALIAYAVQALVVFDNLFSYVPLVIILAAAHAASGKSIVRLQNLPEPRSETSVGLVGAGISVIAIIVIWSVNVPGLRSAHHLVYAASPNQQSAQQNLVFFKRALGDGSFATQEIREQLVAFAANTASKEEVPSSIRKEFATLALEEIEKEVELSPNDARLRIQYAIALDTFGQKEESLAQIQHAIELSPRKQTLHLNMAYRLYDLDRLEEAREAYRYAYELDTSFEQVALSAASGIILTGDVVGGKAMLSEAFGTTTPYNESLFYAYYMTKQWNDLIDMAKTAVEETNGEPTARYRLAQAYAAAGHFTEARTEVAAVIAEHPETRATGEELLGRMFPAR